MDKFSKAENCSRALPRYLVAGLYMILSERVFLATENVQVTQKLRVVTWRELLARSESYKKTQNAIGQFEVIRKIGNSFSQ